MSPDSRWSLSWTLIMGGNDRIDSDSGMILGDFGIGIDRDSQPTTIVVTYRQSRLTPVKRMSDVA